MIVREAGASPVVAAVAAFLLPPLGVFLDRGITPAFWISVGLTILFFVPGVIYALATIFARRPARA